MKDYVKSRKAINFDLSEHLLKLYYPSYNYKNSWKDIQKYLEEQDFIHRQYSGYVSKNSISMTKLGYILDNMVQQYSWLKKCVKQFDITIVGDEYNLFHTIRHKDIS